MNGVYRRLTRDSGSIHISLAHKSQAHTTLPPLYLDLYRKRPNNKDRNTKTGRGGRGPVREGKRQYDRRSGTGRGKEIKKQGGGAHNWGSNRDAAADADQSPTLNNEEDDTPAPAPEPDNTMTMEEYLAQKKEKDSENKLLAATKERTVDDNAFDISKATKAGSDDAFFAGTGGKSKKKEKKEKDVKTVDVGFRVATGADEGGRGRGEGRGGRGGRGEGRGGRSEGRGGRGRGRGEGRGRSGRGG